METISLIQGTPAWHEHRSNHFNASDAPAMLGLSSYKTREKLLQEKATGITDEFDEATERRFADGHRFEALARPLAEAIIGDELYPVVGTEGKLSASFDGLTFDESVAFEHKSLNDRLRGIIGISDLPEEYCAQMEQQLMISGAKKCLFMASKFDANDNLIEELHVWYFPDIKMQNRLLHGWAQFEIDIANYQHVAAAPVVVAAPTKDLPALSIQVNGAISLISNLNKFGAELNAFVAQIDKEPADDQGFADAEAAIKTLQNAQDALEAAEASALAQTADIDDMRKTVKLYADTARTTRLMLEKMVKARKESIRIEIVQTAKAEFSAHYHALELEIKPIVLLVNMPDFAGAIKNKRTLLSLRESVATALRDGKFEAEQLAADIRTKLSWCKESSAGYGFLFADLQSIITSNGMEAFQAIVQRRIDDHKAAEAAKLEAQRVAMQAEADRKAKVEADALIAAERAKIEAEAKAAEDARKEAEFQRFKSEAEETTKAQEAQRAIEQAAAKVERDAELVAIEERRRIAQCKEQERPAATVTPIKAVEMVTIPKAEYERLLKSVEWLECLEAAGVDNWSGFDEARAILNGEAA